MTRLSMAVALLLLLSDCTHSRACSPRHHQDFSSVAAADRLEVLDGDGIRSVVTITDPQKIKLAANFIMQRSDDYSAVLAGPQAPALMLNFFRGSQVLDGVGLARDYLTTGSLSRPTSPAEIDELMRALGVPWPPK